MAPEAALFDIQKLIAAAMAGFVLGVAGNIITFYVLNRREIRDLDRETKRLAFWKAMRELKAAGSEETGLSQVQINALDQRFKEEVQGSVDVMMGWTREAHILASIIVAPVTFLLVAFTVAFTAKWLIPFLDVAQRSGMLPGTALYIGTDIVSVLAFFFAVRMIIYQQLHEIVQQRAVRLMREHHDKFNGGMIFYK
jgi:hypothetical protein